MWVLTFADLRMRSRQFAIATIGSMLVFAVALVMAGLSGGFRSEAKRTVEAVGADAFVVPHGAGGPFINLASLPGGTLSEVRRSAGVTEAAPLVIFEQAFQRADGATDGHVIGFLPGELGTPPSEVAAGLRPGEAIVDRLTKIDVGAEFTIAGRTFRAVDRLSGYSYLAGLPNVYIHLRDAQQLAFAGRGEISTVAVRGAPERLPRGVHLVDNQRSVDDILRRLDNGMRSVDMSQYFLWVVAAVIIGAVVYLSALERVRDFAVLKAIGASSASLYAGLALQSAIVALVAAGLAMAVQPLIAPYIPIPLDIPGYQYVLLPLVAVLVGLLASLSGLRQAVKVDPALAFG